MISQFDHWVARFQAFFVFLFVIGLTFSISLWQYSLLGAVLFTVIRAFREPSQRRLLLSEPLLFSIILIYVVWTALCSYIMNPGEDRFAGVTEEWLFVIVPVTWSVFGSVSWRYRTWLFGALASAAILIPILSITGLLIGFNILRPSDTAALTVGRSTGLFNHPLTFAEVMLGIGALLLFRALFLWKNGRKNTFFWFAAMIAMIGVIASGSRTAIAGLPVVAVSTVIFFWNVLARVRWYLLLAPLAAIALPLIFNEHAFIRATEHVGRDFRNAYQGSRIFIWENSLQIIKEHPILGVGANGFASEYDKQIPDWVEPGYRFGHAHNDLINMTATRGIPGGLLYVLMWGILLWRGGGALLRNRTLQSEESALRFGAMAGLFALLLCGLTESTFVDEEVRGVIMLLWGLLLMPNGLIVQTPKD